MTDERKATAIAHPIQGLVKYHGLRDPDRRLPYHDSISVCTAPSRTVTTAAFEVDREHDCYVVDGEAVEGRAEERIGAVVDEIRSRTGLDDGVRLESENSFPTNVGLGSSSSGFAAAAVALAAAAGLEASPGDLSAIARLGSSSAARSVTGGFSHLRTGLNDHDCRSERIESDLEERLRFVVGLVPAYKETEAAHREAAESHMFPSRMAHIHGQIAECRDALMSNDFDRTFSLAERDSISLAATTMTGPAAWIYWRPVTLEIFEAVRSLREDEGIPAYVSTDTGATVYVNTMEEHLERVEATVADCGVETMRWHVGGPARVVEPSAALF